MVPVLAEAGLGEHATLAAMLVGPTQVAIRLVDAVFLARLHPLSIATISALALPLSVAGLVLGLAPWAAGILFATLFGVGQGLASIVRGTCLSFFSVAKATRAPWSACDAAYLHDRRSAVRVLRARCRDRPDAHSLDIRGGGGCCGTAAPQASGEAGEAGHLGH